VPVTDFVSKPDHIKILEDWMKSYHAEELFDAGGKLVEELAELAPKGDRRMPQIPGPVMRMAPKPNRFTCSSPPSESVPTRPADRFCARVLIPVPRGRNCTPFVG